MEARTTGENINDHPFYTLKSSGLNDDGALAFSIEINPNHPVFDGHFPKYPVVPGVMMMKVFKELISSHYGHALRLQSAKDIKFMSLIVPKAAMILSITIKLRELENGIDAGIIVKEGETVCIKMNGTYIEQES